VTFIPLIVNWYSGVVSNLSLSVTFAVKSIERVATKCGLRECENDF
jgi:hypothetical protein